MSQSINSLRSGLYSQLLFCSIWPDCLHRNRACITFDQEHFRGHKRVCSLKLIGSNSHSFFERKYLPTTFKGLRGYGGWRITAVSEKKYEIFISSTEISLNVYSAKNSQLKSNFKVSKSEFKLPSRLEALNIFENLNKYFFRWQKPHLRAFSSKPLILI